jgi:phosphomannomutase
VRFAARPSGTEPKIKFYLFARSEVKGPEHLAEAKAQTAARLDRMATDIEDYITSVLSASG